MELLQELYEIHEGSVDLLLMAYRRVRGMD